MMKKFFRIFPAEFDLLFYGVDIIVDSETGVHYFVDCNYLANYNSIPQGELIAALDSLLVRQIAEVKGEVPLTPRGEKASNFSFKGQELTPRSVENVAVASVGALALGLICSFAYLAMRRKQD